MAQATTMERVECPTCGRIEDMYTDRDTDQCPECYLRDNDEDEW